MCSTDAGQLGSVERLAWALVQVNREAAIPGIPKPISQVPEE